MVDRRRIALNYLRGWFFIDLVSTFPLYIVMNYVTEDNNTQSVGNYNNILRLVRLPRIYKLAKVRCCVPLTFRCSGSCRSRSSRRSISSSSS